MRRPLGTLAIAETGTRTENEIGTTPETIAAGRGTEIAIAIGTATGATGIGTGTETATEGIEIGTETGTETGTATGTGATDAIVRGNVVGGNAGIDVGRTRIRRRRPRTKRSASWRPLSASERDVFEFFSQAGMVTDVRLITDRNTRRSKGLAYVEMSDAAGALGALGLSGQPLKGQCVMVKSSEAEKNLVQPTPSNTQSAGAANPALMTVALLLENLNEHLTAMDIRTLCEPFGEVVVRFKLRATACDLYRCGLLEVEYIPTSTKATVTFKQADDASRALGQLNGLQMVDRPIKVTIAPAATPVPVAAGAPQSYGELDEGGNFAPYCHPLVARMQPGLIRVGLGEVEAG
eukprot:scaffold3759_cov425-Prasinococcus_capsulatus_cf.AAC.18